ncbi:MAG: cellobiose phosphorylase [Lachnospiraceae bacterium]|nr:cellobiose phosphorylase [Lachnospiraceae bacterium]
MSNIRTGQYEFLDEKGTFRLEGPENVSYLYFPIAGEQGIKGAVTPSLGGDLKRNQNEFILQPVSAEELHNNRSTRNFWCYLGEKGCLSVTGASAEEEGKKFTKDQECSVLTAGPMWHRIERKSEKYALSSNITSFVPVSEYCVEIMHVEIKNEGKEEVSVIPTAAIPLYGRSADNIRDHRHVTSLLHRAVTTHKGVLVTPTLSFDERGHQKNHITYYVCGMEGDGTAPAGFMPVAEDYIGEGGSFERPESVVLNLPYDACGKQYDGYEIVGALRFAEARLQSGEKRSYTIFIGAEENKEMIDAMLLKYENESTVLEALERTKKYWLDKLNVSYETADSNFDNFMYWVNFQPMLRRIYGCSFLPHHDYGKGGRGWRDLWQDCLALLIMNPDGVRQMLVDNYGGVRIDGSNATIIGNRQGEFIADRNNITRVWMDHGLWPLMTTKLYIDQTGDLSVLLKENTYFKDKQEARGTGIDENWESDSLPVLKEKGGKPYYGTILEHILVQNLTVFYEVGEHNHMRLRGADWNDALDMASERGESVAFTAAYADNLEVLAELIGLLEEEKQMHSVELLKEIEPLLQTGTDFYEDTDQKKEVLSEYCKACFHHISGVKVYPDSEFVRKSLMEKAKWIREHIRRTEWITEDEECGWFNSYYDDHGQKCEGRSENGVRMMLTGQVFTIMSKTATKEQTAKIIKAADKYLYKKEVGGYRLNTDFGELKTDLGRMFGFAYGHKENGAVFSHMTTMYANALYRQGFAKEGYRALYSLYEQAACFEKSKIYPGIPEYFNDRGRGMYHYLTGAASWMMLTVITEMFGIKGRCGALVLEPKLQKEQFKEGRAGIYLTFGKRKWHIVYMNTENKQGGEYRIGNVYLDGNKKEINEMEVSVSLEEIKMLDEEMIHEMIVELK